MTRARNQNVHFGVPLQYNNHRVLYRLAKKKKISELIKKYLKLLRNDIQTLLKAVRLLCTFSRSATYWKYPIVCWITIINTRLPYFLRWFRPLIISVQYNTKYLLYLERTHDSANIITIRWIIIIILYWT
jgi:hypothetical protein